MQQTNRSFLDIDIGSDKLCRKVGLGVPCDIKDFQARSINFRIYASKSKRVFFNIRFNIRNLNDCASRTCNWIPCILHTFGEHAYLKEIYFLTETKML